ncbi:response regulator transcription factor [Micrococcus endophyticus]|uniref:Two-component system response regulator DesR n=1 Tax=Micrococcus endophyticus TaxID=455343 RepID=A0A7W9MZ75_9MICC|nr:response regulator transcription factor [Micrococcus endophyticus]MBB5847680.1 two-component system response regulator DesR [Micrococcus endophyticus]
MSRDPGIGSAPGRAEPRGTEQSPAEPSATAPLRLLLADDQALVRGALAALLGAEPDLEVVVELGSGEGVPEAVAAHGVDVALLDIEMPGVDGLQALERLRAQGLDCAVLMVTTFGRPGYLGRALALGAQGFVVKDTPAEALAEAVRAAARGERVVDPTLAVDSLAAGASPLTPREADVLREALTGASVRAIAARLHLSSGTVRNHLSAAIGKTATSTRGEAAVVARDRGWL